MDMPQDEIRRQLRDADRAQADALPRWKRALDRTIEEPHSPALTAAVLNVPTRRGFLKIGGLTIAGAAVVAACTPEPKKEQITQTGQTPTTTAALPYEEAGDIATDITLLRVAQSIEKLAIAAYDAAIGANLLSGAAADAAKLFRDHHNEHFGLLRSTVTGIGGESYDQANPALVKAVLEPAAASIKDGKATAAAILELAAELEDTAAQTYTNAVTLLTTAELRQAIMSIGAVEARHVAVLLGAKNPDNHLLQVPFAFEKTAGAVKPRSDAVNAVGAGGSVPSTTKAPTRSTTTSRAPGTTAAAPAGTTPGSAPATTAAG